MDQGWDGIRAKTEEIELVQSNNERKRERKTVVFQRNSGFAEVA